MENLCYAELGLTNVDYFNFLCFFVRESLLYNRTITIIVFKHCVIIMLQYFKYLLSIHIIFCYHTFH